MLSVKENVHDNLIIKRRMSFSSESRDVYVSMFEELKKNGCSDSDYDDKVWTFRNYKGLPGVTRFDFELPLDLQYWEEPLKAIVVIKLKNKNMPKSIRIGNLVKGIVVSSGLQDLGSFKVFYDGLIPQYKAGIKALVLDLVDFIEFPDLKVEDIKRIVNVDVQSSQREIPPLNDIIILNESIDRFIDEWSIDEQRFYMPFIIYWMLSNIIPIRPLEYIIMPYECLPDERNELSIRIPRLKERENYFEDPFIDTIPINDGQIVKLINKYKEIAEYPSSPVYLLSYSTYLSSANKSDVRKSSESMFLYKQLVYVRDRFYSDIVMERYGLANESLIKIRFGDTRHLAICNMMFSGYSPLTIMRLANHKDIVTQNAYAAHMDLYAQSRVIQLTEVFRRAVRRLWSGDTRSLHKISEGVRIRKNLFDKNNFKYLWELKHGCYCYYTPLDCPTNDCRSCCYLYVPKENWKEALPWLTEESDRLQCIIHETLDRMESLRKLVSNETEMKNTAGELEALVHKKALVDAHCLEVKSNWDKKLQKQRQIGDTYLMLEGEDASGSKD